MSFFADQPVVWLLARVKELVGEPFLDGVGIKRRTTKMPSRAMAIVRKR